MLRVRLHKRKPQRKDAFPARPDRNSTRWHVKIWADGHLKACKSRNISQSDICSPGCRHVRESQQEYTVAGLLSHPSSIGPSIYLNAVAPFVQLPFGWGRRENPVQGIGVSKRTKQLVAQVTEQIYLMSDLWALTPLLVQSMHRDICCVQGLTCSVSISPDTDHRLKMHSHTYPHTLPPFTLTICFVPALWDERLGLRAQVSR